MRIGQRFAAAGAAIVMACGLGLAGCSGDEGDGAQESSAVPAVVAEEGAFPVTIEHAFGETTIEKAPERVFSLGWTDVDTLLALGVTPVGGVEWHTDKPMAWQKNAETGEEPTFDIPVGEVDPEEIAAFEPDLIIAQWIGLEQEQYDRLSEIAPVVPYAEEYPDWSQPWDVTAERIGRAVGRPKAAKALIDEVQAKFDGIQERHPEWREMSAVAGLYSEDDGQLSMLTTLDPRGAFFGKLGFRMSPEVDAMVGEDVWAEISLEQASVVDEDVFFLYGDSDESFMAQPVLAGLDVAKKGHVIPLGLLAADDPMLAEAFEWQSVLSLGYLLDGIEEPLAEALAE
ncbi:ABC transporter substrate-binding protein [Corynebacterium sphenisci]|uniref:ABC transporter substrate-binding protein n=1 Tax=Corynebacterium sphenisci TaxID=191493 RepID=UPI0026DEBD82|nr:iron-siderophore ABC transporter substrate-binding protein [Corynebacterium sphenisci]MDO5730558.1 iron-siderophore ABC transporter substrate-binding protein [Corynebacterium sphenisci]